MNETLNQAIDVLRQLQFETGGPLLDHVVALERELIRERQRRIAELREAGLTDAQIGQPAEGDVRRQTEPVKEMEKVR